MSDFLSFYVVEQSINDATHGMLLQDGVACVTHPNRALLFIIRKPRHLQSLFNHRAEITVFNMGSSRPGDEAGCEDPLFVAWCRFLNAVCGK